METMDFHQIIEQKLCDETCGWMLSKQTAT